MTQDKVFDVAILGAGLAGMTAAYQLRDRNIVVLEKEERVGGRTLSGEWEGYWYNLGAQFVWDSRTVKLCEELGVELKSAEGARSALYMRGRLVDAPNPYMLLLRMPISIRDKIDFAWTITRLRRLAARFPNVDRYGLDSRPLSELVEKASAPTKQILNQVTESSCGLPLEEVSAYIGLGYAIHLFGGDVNDTLKGVAGGTQMIPRAIQNAIGEDRVRLGVDVTHVRQENGAVAVAYRQGRSEEMLQARSCIITLPAGPTLSVVDGMPQDKREALEAKVPYTRVLITVWLTEETGPMPWDRFLTVPVLGKSFDLISNHAFFLRRSGGRRPRGILATLSTRGKADTLWDLPDDELQARIKGDLLEIFPDAESVFREALVHRWDALPVFRRGSLKELEVVRRPVGPIFFAGDYTAQPGTPGAVGSGYYAARSARELLESPPLS